MKRVIRKFFFAAAIAIAALSNVDAQNSFPYQAVIRTAKGELVSNQEIAMQFSLIYDGKVVYSETQKPKTNQYGNVKVEVGNGRKVSGDFAAVPWSTMQVMMKIEADPNGGTDYIDLGTIQLQPAPYAMYATAAGMVNTVEAGEPKSDSNALFEVKDKDGNVVFAVYPDGVRVFVDDADSTAAKAMRTGFAVSGRRAAKEGGEANYFEVTAGGTQVLVDEDTAAKAMRTGFAVAGRRAAKDGSADLFTVSSTGTQIYIGEQEGKPISTGFAVSGRRAAKEEEKYLEINADGTRVYVDEDSTKAIRTGFAVSGRRAAKGENSKFLEINADGTKVYVDDDEKAMRTGFAVAGRKAAKGKEPKLFEVNSFGTQIYIDTEKDKAMRTGFAVSGRRAAKEGNPEKYLVIDADGTRIYVDYEEAKAIRTGFAVSGRKAAKNGTPNTILKVDNVEGTRAYVEDIDGKAISTGFAVSGRRAAKDGEPDFFHITSDQATITATNITMQDKDTDKDMMSITSGNTSIYTDDFSLSNNDDTEMLTANNGGVEVSTELVIAGEVAQTVDVEENEDVDPLVLSAFGMIETVKIADSIPDLDAPKGYSLLKIYGNGKFAQTQNLDAEENTYMLFNAAGNLVANQSDAVAAVILTNASTPDAKLIIWPLKQVNNAPISLGLMAAGDTLNRYVPVNVYVNADGPVECLVDVKSADEELGKVRIEGPKVYGSKVEIHAEPIVEGYHFAGWSDERSANPRTVLILHDTAFADATFAINTYNIKTTAENGEIEISGQQNDDGTFNHGTEVGLKPFASEHYHFMGWTDGEADAARNFKIVSDTTFEAIFAIDSFDIKTSLAEGGSVTGVGKFPYGAEIELVATPDEANGYHFVNWNDGNADNPRKLIVEDESTFTAYFDKNRYLLTYVVDGEVFDVDTIACDAQIVPINAPDKVGHNFKGWENMLGVMPKDNLTVIAQYDPKTYTITFNTGDGSTIDPVSAVYNTTISEPKQPEYANHSFTGWFADADCTKPFDFNAPVTDNATAYAGWEVNSYSITIAQAEGGSADVTTGANAENNTYTHETQVEVSASPDDENGYEFVKWTAEGVELDKDQVNNRLLKFNITSDVKLTPVFALKKYHINATAEDGGSISTDGLDQDNYAVHGTKITLTAAPTDNTYEFKGWQIIGTSVEGFDLSENQKTSETIEIEVKNDFDIKAKFDLITYPVVATTDGNGSVRIIVTEGLPAEGNNYIVGTVVTFVAEPNDTYEFDKWTGIEGITLDGEQIKNDQIQAITVESEIKVKATFKRKMAVTFVANGGQFSDDANATQKTIYISQGTAIDGQIPALTREGYTLANWFDSNNKPFDFYGVITRDTVLTAQWAIEFYVAADGSNAEGRKGTIVEPFATVQKAFETILDKNLTNTNYRIVVLGELLGSQSLGDYFDDGETSTKLEGTTITLIGQEYEGQYPVINGNSTGNPESDNVALHVFTNIPVIIENLKITNGSGVEGGGIFIRSDEENDDVISHVTLGNGVIIEGNSASQDGGGGVYVSGKGSKLTMLQGSKISENQCAWGSGAGVYVSDDAEFDMQGGEISGNIPNGVICGVGVYLGPKSKFSMSGDARVCGGDDIYFEKSGNGGAAPIINVGKLEGTDIVATISFNGNYYSTGDKLLEVAGIETLPVDRFKVAPFDNHYYRINSDGKLVEQNAAKFVYYQYNAAKDEQEEVEVSVIQFDKNTALGNIAPEAPKDPDNFKGWYILTYDGLTDEFDSEMKPEESITFVGVWSKVVEVSEGGVISSIYDAVNKVDAYSDLTIKVNGTLNGAQKICDCNLHSLIIEGKTGTDGTIDAGWDGEIDEWFYPNEESEHTGSVLTIATAAPVTIKNLKITGGCLKDSYEGANLGGGILIGAYYDENNMNYVSCASNVTLGDGAVVTKNYSKNLGGGVYVYPGSTFIIENEAEISNNTSLFGGAGVCFYPYGNNISNSITNIVMNGGTISNNKSKVNDDGYYSGAGVLLYLSVDEEFQSSVTFEMNGGSIKNNESGGYGSGVCVKGNSAQFIMKNDAQISENKATDTYSGGGVFVGYEGKFKMEGGTITGNNAVVQGKGVYVSSDATFSMSGSAVVASNNEIYLNGSHITLNGELAGSGTVATITPNEYDDDVLVLNGENVGDYYDRFAVTPQVISGGKTINWIIDENGYLFEYDPQTFYIDPENGNDNNDGHTPGKATKSFYGTSQKITDLQQDYTFVVMGDYYDGENVSLHDSQKEIQSITVRGNTGNTTDYVNCGGGLVTYVPTNFENIKVYSIWFDYESDNIPITLGQNAIVEQQIETVPANSSVTMLPGSQAGSITSAGAVVMHGGEVTGYDSDGDDVNETFVVINDGGTFTMRRDAKPNYVQTSIIYIDSVLTYESGDPYQTTIKANWADLVGQKVLEIVSNDFTQGMNIAQIKDYFDLDDADYYIDDDGKVRTSVPFEFEEGGTSVTITNYTGSSNDVVIPATVNGKPVTVIGSNTFSSNSGIKSITIPSSVTSIAANVFKYCYSLNTVHYEGSEAQWCGIQFGNGDSNPCRNGASGKITALYFGDSETADLEIPEGVTQINDYAFYGCRCLTSVSFPSTLTSIGNEAFYYCKGLRSVFIPANVETIGNNAFGSSKYVFCEASGKPEGWNSQWSHATVLYGQTSLKKFDYTVTNETTKTVEIGPYYGSDRDVTVPGIITIGEEDYTVTSIKSNLFSEHKTLTTVTFPNTITEISGSTFYLCSNLESINIPASVTTIDPSAIYGCENLQSVTVDAGNVAYKTENNTLFSMDGTKLVLYYAKKSQVNYVVPSTVTEICDYAFDCSQISGIDMSASTSLQTIGDGAFNACQNDDFTTVALPASVTSIGRDAFAYDHIATINIPNGVTEIQSGTFTSCDMESIEIPASVTKINDEAFYCCGQLKTITLKSASYTTFDEGAFYGCNNLTTVYFAGTESQKASLIGTFSSDSPIVKATWICSGD